MSLTPTTLADSDLGRRLRAVPAPRPVLDRDREAQLTDRQREVLDGLGHLFDNGFAELTMAGIAAHVGCSLRTLYDLAPSRDELVLPSSTATFVVSADRPLGLSIPARNPWPPSEPTW